MPMVPTGLTSIQETWELPSFFQKRRPYQLLTRLAAFTVPMPVAKSQPVLVAKAGAKDVVLVERTP